MEVNLQGIDIHDSDKLAKVPKVPTMNAAVLETESLAVNNLHDIAYCLPLMAVAPIQTFTYFIMVTKWIGKRKKLNKISR